MSPSLCCPEHQSTAGRRCPLSTGYSADYWWGQSRILSIWKKLCAPSEGQGSCSTKRRRVSVSVGPVSFSAQEEFVPIDNNSRFIRKKCWANIKIFKYFFGWECVDNVELGNRPWSNERVHFVWWRVLKRQFGTHKIHSISTCKHKICHFALNTLKISFYPQMVLLS